MPIKRRFILIINIVMATIYFFIAHEELSGYLQDNPYWSFSSLDYVNRLFIFNDATHYPYMESLSLINYLPLYLFCLLTLVWSIAPFVQLDFRFYSLIAIRVRNTPQLVKIIRKQSITYQLVGLTSYYVTIALFILLMTNHVQIISCFKLLGLLFILHSLVLITGARVLFWIYFYFGEVRYFITSSGILALLFLLNRAYPKLSFLFIWHGNFWIVPLIISIIFIIVNIYLTYQGKYYWREQHD